jgi:hypothetical protein
MPLMTLRLEENQQKAPVIKQDESMDVPTLRRAEQGLSPTGTLALDVEPKAAPRVVVPIIDVNRSLAATLDTYHVDLSKPSERQPAPPEPEWLDEGDLEEVFSVDPRSNPAAFHLGKRVGS